MHDFFFFSKTAKKRGKADEEKEKEPVKELTDDDSEDELELGEIRPEEETPAAEETPETPVAVTKRPRGRPKVKKDVDTPPSTPGASTQKGWKSRLIMTISVHLNTNYSNVY